MRSKLREYGQDIDGAKWSGLNMNAKLTPVGLAP